MQRPMVPNISARTPTSSVPGMLQNYNRNYQQWLGQRSQNSQFVQGQRALLTDVANNEASQQLQFEQGQGLFQQNQALTGQVDQRILGTAEQTAGQLDQIAGQTAQMGGQALNDFNQMYDRNRADLMGSLGEANAMADSGVGEFERARTDYQDMSAQTVSAMLGGMAQDIDSRMKQLQGGLGPGGEQMTPEMVADMTHQMKSQWAGQRYQVATQLLAQQNEVMAKLSQDVGQAKLGAAGIRSGNAQTQAGFDTAGQAQLLDAHQQRISTQGMANDLYAMSANIRNGAQVLAIDRQLQGMQFGAQLAKEFPYSPTSMFDVFLNMMQLQQAGAGRRPGFSMPQNMAMA